eukprot:TRINITY_DN2502_c0_g1_i1.p1 TRINITY_DN2502_c0_g1~~TRINITY_DN2502_c0_g1_i1.p1  ORF type:complete len:407 (+),score=75.11 TRINITY_DN2502_c0_g1_i1:99-1319(+)
MLSFFEPLKKLCKQEKVAIDNEVFRLHYKVTVILFILFSGMLTAKQYFGDPIDCMVNGVPAKIVNTYCWVHGTFTMKNLKMDQVRAYTPAEKSYFDKMGHTGTSHPGIATSDPVKNYKVYHTYYQWVGFILFFQAILFYLPRHLWKHIEGGKVRFCTKDMKEPELDDETRSIRVTRLMKCYIKYKNKNNQYALQFFLFEMINLMNVIIQIFYINKFIGGRFLDYGSQILNYYNHIDIGIDPMVEVFPKVTKCQFNRHGPGGDINNHDALCLLPLNIVNEKIYLVMWLWLIVLAVASSVAVLYRAACIIFPGVRTYILWGETSKWSHIAEVCKNGQYGDWFLLRQISKNVDQETFDEFLKQISKDIDPWDTPVSQSRCNLYELCLGVMVQIKNSDSGCSTERTAGKL